MAGPLVSVAGFDPLDPATLQCPQPWHAALRREEPVHYVPERDLWMVTSHALVAEALADHTVFSSVVTGGPHSPVPESVREQVEEVNRTGWPSVNVLLTTDPPEHRYYRRKLAKAFTPRSVASYEPHVREIVSTLAERIQVDRAVEFVSGFASVLPLLVIARVLNVSQERIEDFRHWSDIVSADIGAEVDADAAVHHARELLEYQRYFAAELDARRAEPGNDVLSLLVSPLSEGNTDDEPLSTAACLSIIRQLLIAGNETSRKLLTAALHQLAVHPRWWEWLRANPSERAAAIVEESVRWLSPAHSMFRVTTTEATLGGYHIPAGARVALVFGSANRDDAVFAEPDEFNPERDNLRAHLAFGAGIHACIGAPLARQQARVALVELVTRFASVSCADGNDFAYTPSYVLRGLTRLFLVFHT